jgi:hypothetical protein
MICDEFEKLTPKEKTEFIGQVVHSIQSDSGLYSMGQEIIRLGKIKGLFEGVTILPEDTENH